MKQSFIKFLIITLVVIVFSACSNDSKTKNAQGIADVVADPDFMFNTSISVNLILNSVNNGNPAPNAGFEIYNAFPKDGGARVLQAKTDENGFFEFNLPIASCKNSLILYNENKDFYELEIIRIDDLSGSIEATFNTPFNSGERSAPTWAFNSSPYYATVYADVYDYEAGYYSDDVNDMFGCFIGNTCVGVAGGSFPGAELMTNGRVRFTNTVYFPNTSHHNVNFRFYDASLDAVFAFDYWYYIHDQDVYGDPVNPDTFYYSSEMPMPDPYILSASFPAVGQFGTIAFEDKWPQQGDYDINDFVLYGNFNIYLTDMVNWSGYYEIDFKLAALGAAYTIGFGIQFPENLNLSNVASTTGTAYLEDDDHTLIFCDNARDILPGSGFINTDPALPYIEPVLHTVTVDFEDTWGRMVMLPWMEVPYNVFIFINGDRSHEIHPADYPPTELVNEDNFGEMDDTSDLDDWRYYRTVNNLPWCFMLPIELPYPKERCSILDAYPFFDDWVASPWDYEDWYLDEPGHRDYDYIYLPPGD